MGTLDKIFPRQANNDYEGSPIAFYGFCLIVAMTTFRSLVHLLAPDSGLQSIATIILFPGDPDPNQVIRVFSSLWGGQQLLMVFLYGIALWRYRNLIPLLLLLFIIEILFRLLSGTLHPLGPEYYASTPPGKLGNLPVLAITIVFFVLSLRPRAKG